MLSRSEMKKLKRVRKKKKQQLIVRVLTRENTYHSIAIINDRVVLLDHQKTNDMTETEVAILALGEKYTEIENCRCHETLNRIKLRRWNLLPARLEKFYKDKSEKSARRNLNRKEIPVTDKLSSKSARYIQTENQCFELFREDERRRLIEEQVDKKIKKIFTRIPTKATAIHSKDFFSQFKTVFPRSVDITSKVPRLTYALESSEYPGKIAAIYLYLDTKKWLMEVYRDVWKKYFADSEDCLIPMEVQKIDDKTQIVLCCKIATESPGHGYTIDLTIVTCLVHLSEVTPGKYTAGEIYLKR